MAKCKVCNKRIDFDEKDKSVILGEILGASLDNALIKTPVFGKYAYIRRGRHYWHIDCYPDTLKGSFDQDKFEEELSKAIDELREKSIEKLKNSQDELLIQEEAIKRLVVEKEEAEKERTRFFDELSIYKIDLAKAREENKKLQHDIDSAPPPEETFKVEEENAKLKKDLVEFEKLKKQLQDLGINGTPK